MGRIAPRKRKTTWDYQTLVHFCQRIIQRQPSDAVAVENDEANEEQERLSPLPCVNV